MVAKPKRTGSHTSKAWRPCPTVALSNSSGQTEHDFCPIAFFILDLADVRAWICYIYRCSIATLPCCIHCFGNTRQFRKQLQNRYRQIDIASNILVNRIVVIYPHNSHVCIMRRTRAGCSIDSLGNNNHPGQANLQGSSHVAAAAAAAAHEFLHCAQLSWFFMQTKMHSAQSPGSWLILGPFRESTNDVVALSHSLFKNIPFRVLFCFLQDMLLESQHVLPLCLYGGIGTTSELPTFICRTGKSYIVIVWQMLISPHNHMAKW